MSEQIKHTPLPWEAGRMVDDDGLPYDKERAKKHACEAIDNGNDDGFFFVSRGDGEPIICHTGNGLTSRENSEFIAFACNNHQTLIKGVNAMGEEIKDLKSETAALAEEVKRLTEERDGLRDVVKETAKVLFSGTPSIVDTVWVTGDRNLTLFDMCMSALAEPKEVTP